MPENLTQAWRHQAKQWEAEAARLRATVEELEGELNIAGHFLANIIGELSRTRKDGIGNIYLDEFKRQYLRVNAALARAKDKNNV